MAANDDHRDDTLRLSREYLERQRRRLTPSVRAVFNDYVCAICGQPYARPDDRVEHGGKFYHRECLWNAQRESEKTK